MTKKPLCQCGHSATKHSNMHYTNKKGEAKHYTKCRIKECPCEKYKEGTLTAEEATKNVEEKVDEPTIIIPPDLSIPMI